MTPLFLPSTPVRESSYPGLNQCSFILPAGFRQEEGRMATTCPILVEQDIPVRLRDGVTIRVDIFRPAGTERVPVIMGWSSYGKRASWLTLDLFGHPTRMDVKKEWEDGLNKFEGPNPAYWVAHGYAVAAPDPRGVFMSEGDIQAWGPQEARDEYDVIEWLAARPWCNGKIGLSGTSMLAMTQYFVAALRPPHLAAIAPCEGASDLYKDNLARGGIPANLFASQIFSHVYGNGRTEDLAGMIAREPLYNEYWASKAAELERIITPAYIVASWTNLVHTGGTFRAWERISSAEKWLRVHNTHEWHEYYRPDHVEELRRFFDYYLKGRENGWPDTPRVRLAVLNPGHEDILDRKESEFPLNREKYRLFHLGEQEKLSESPLEHGVTLRYVPEKESAVFRMVCRQDMEVTGYIMLRLWVEAEGADDMDLFAFVRKRDGEGRLLLSRVVTGRTFAGANGRLRVSLRESGEMAPYRPDPFFRTEKKLSPGEIVPVDIGFWPTAMRWNRGEILELVVCGHDLLIRPEFPDMPAEKTINRGTHVLHLGGDFDSFLALPCIEIP